MLPLGANLLLAKLDWAAAVTLRTMLSPIHLCRGCWELPSTVEWKKFRFERLFFLRLESAFSTLGFRTRALRLNVKKRHQKTPITGKSWTKFLQTTARQLARISSQTSSPKTRKFDGKTTCPSQKKIAKNSRKTLLLWNRSLTWNLSSRS